MSDTNRTTLEQGRAKFAYECAENGAKVKKQASVLYNDDIYYKDDKYKSYVKDIPMMIKTNGLGATFSFVLSKSAKEKKGKKLGERDNPKNAYDLIYKQTHDWLKQDDKLGIFASANSNDLVQIIISQNSAEYRYLTVEVLALFNWLRRFAEGLIEGEDTGGES